MARAYDAVSGRKAPAGQYDDDIHYPCPVNARTGAVINAGGAAWSHCRARYAKLHSGDAFSMQR